MSLTKLLNDARRATRSLSGAPSIGGDACHVVHDVGVVAASRREQLGVTLASD